MWFPHEALQQQARVPSRAIPRSNRMRFRNEFLLCLQCAVSTSCGFVAYGAKERKFPVGKRGFAAASSASPELIDRY